jgi:hypothetical protein
LAENDYTTEFRVWVCNRHPTGATAFVLPAAEKPGTAIAEWDRRRAFLDGKPRRLKECAKSSELMEYFYRRQCQVAENDWYLYSFDEVAGEAVAITPRGNILKLTGAREFVRLHEAAKLSPIVPRPGDVLPATEQTLDQLVQMFGKQERLYRL